MLTGQQLEALVRDIGQGVTADEAMQKVKERAVDLGLNLTDKQLADLAQKCKTLEHGRRFVGN